MYKYRFFLFLYLIPLFLCAFNSIQAQSKMFFEDNLIEKTNLQEQFSAHLDSANTYRYSDSELNASYLQKCKKILDQNASISDSLKLEYATSSIYLQFSKLDPLSAFKVVTQNESLLKGDVSKEQVRLFNYLKSFTLMSNGDLEAAQKAFYHGIELGIADKDTMTVINNLYSLGQLLFDEKDYNGSAKKYQRVLSYVDMYDIPASTHALTHFELASVYYRLKDYAAAKKQSSLCQNVVEANKLEFLRPPIFNLRGRVLLAQNKLDSAEIVLNELKSFDSSKHNEIYKTNILELQARIYNAKKMYHLALDIYQNQISSTDTTQIDDLLNFNANAHKVCNSLGDYQTAYNFLLSHNRLKDRIDSDKKRQKTAYLKVKYDSEQKEKDNIVLKSELYRQEAQRNLLFGGLAIAFFLLFGLFAALYQKAKYNQRLEETVLQRTEKLRLSNEELGELNRILSHDLKEPLRNIVGFSSLANNEIPKDSEAQEYLDIVIKSGKQLNQLIDDVNILQQSNTPMPEKQTNLKVDQLFRKVTKKIQSSYNQKSIKLSCETNLEIKGPKATLEKVFKIIVDNATKFNENEEVLIDVGYELQDKKHYFKIKDNGIGIDKKYQNKVFGLFKRLNHRDNYTGSGLGLSIAQRLIKGIGGDIAIFHSKLNHGTTMLVSFPVETLEIEDQKSKNSEPNILVPSGM